MYTEPNSVRMIAPVGHASRQPARAQCLQTSDIISREKLPPSVPPSGTGRSTKPTCRQVEEPRWPVLSYESPVNSKPSSGNWFHCLHATSQALHPMQSVVSVKKPFIPSLLGRLVLQRLLLERPQPDDVARHRQLRQLAVSAHRRPPRAPTPAGADVAGQRLRFLDVHV